MRLAGNYFDANFGELCRKMSYDKIFLNERSCPHGFESLLFSYETNRHPPLFIGVPEKRELFGEKEQQRSA